MKSLSRILRRNKKQRLGRFNRELVIRLAIKKLKMAKPVYHLLLARRRSRAGCRYDKLGFFEIFTDNRRTFNVFGINRQKIKDAMTEGAYFHVSVYKLLIH
jgi:ribosomal protein S16